MFTGLVEEQGRVLSLEPNGDGIRLCIEAEVVMDDVSLGASIAVNGVCLTVVDFDSESFSVDAVPETMSRSNLGRLGIDSLVNLERAVRVSDRLGGHIVQGHVDMTAPVLGVDELDDGSFHFHFGLHSDLAPFVVEKGSITLDGVSLTIAGLTEDRFTVAIIPHTAALTTLGGRQPTDVVNVEADVLAKYVQRQLSHLQVTP